MPARVTARIAAFIPGASPPEVSIPIVFILVIILITLSSFYMLII